MGCDFQQRNPGNQPFLLSPQILSDKHGLCMVLFVGLPRFCADQKVFASVCIQFPISSTNLETSSTTRTPVPGSQGPRVPGSLESPLSTDQMVMTSCQLDPQIALSVMTRERLPSCEASPNAPEGWREQQSWFDGTVEVLETARNTQIVGDFVNIHQSIATRIHWTSGNTREFLLTMRNHPVLCWFSFKQYIRCSPVYAQRILIAQYPYDSPISIPHVFPMKWGGFRFVITGYPQSSSISNDGNPKFDGRARMCSVSYISRPIVCQWYGDKRVCIYIYMRIYIYIHMCERHLTPSTLATGRQFNWRRQDWPPSQWWWFQLTKTRLTS